MLRGSKSEKTTLMLMHLRGSYSTHHQGIKGVNQCERKPTEMEEEM